jgi:hypothetical protein
MPIWFKGGRRSRHRTPRQPQAGGRRGREAAFGAAARRGGARLAVDADAALRDQLLAGPPRRDARRREDLRGGRAGARGRAARARRRPAAPGAPRGWAGPYKLGLCPLPVGPRLLPFLHLSHARTHTYTHPAARALASRCSRLGSGGASGGLGGPLRSLLPTGPSKSGAAAHTCRAQAARGRCCHGYKPARGRRLGVGGSGAAPAVASATPGRLRRPTSGRMGWFFREAKHAWCISLCNARGRSPHAV